MALSGKRRFLILLGFMLAILASFLIFKQDRAHLQTLDKDTSPLPSASNKSRTSRAETRSHPDDDRLATPGTIATPDPKTATLIQSSLAAFRNGPETDEGWNILKTLREGIRGAPEDAAAATILAFLKSGEDTPTGLPFTVGPDGMMDAVPTLRIALLDLLPSLDPRAALQMAREVMAVRTTPDEYALALRNMAWNDLNGDLRSELSARFADLLKSPWLDQPSSGFLESFDIAVEIGGRPMFDRMASVAHDAEVKSNTAAGQAAYMSMDRMIVRDPALLATSFTGNAAWMDFAPIQRASLLSRLDIVDPAQRDVFLRYLTSAPHGDGELDYFANIFPNENFLYGNRLVTTDEKTPTIAEVAVADTRVLQELDKMKVSGDAATTIHSIRDHLKATTATP